MRVNCEPVVLLLTVAQFNTVDVIALIVGLLYDLNVNVLCKYGRFW